MFSLIQYKPFSVAGYKYPGWAVGLGWLIAAMSIVCIPAGMVHAVATAKGASLIQVPTSFWYFDFICSKLTNNWQNDTSTARLQCKTGLTMGLYEIRKLVRQWPWYLCLFFLLYQNVFKILVTLFLSYFMRSLTRYSQINYMDQCITK